MEIQMITDYIEAPYNMKEEDFEKIRELVEKYPFFHTANMLYVKAAHNINYQDYDSLIVKVSASVPNREILHSLINQQEVIEIEELIVKDEKIESGARKEIRDRIVKRRKQRQIEKGEILNDDGKSWHFSIIDKFFEPSIEDLVQEFNRTVGKTADKVVAKEIIAVKKEKEINIVPELKTKQKEQKVEKQTEKLIEDVRKEDEFTNIVILPGEKTVDDPLSDDNVKDKVNEEIKPEIKEETKPEVKEETKKEVEGKTKATIRSRKKTKQVIVEDIDSKNLDEGKDEGEVIENIYDRIITSKKPKSENGKKPDFIEINDDITGLEDKEIKEPIIDDPVEIISEDKPEIKEEIISEDPYIKIEDKTEIQIEEKPAVNDVKAEEELIIEDESEDIISVTEDKQEVVKEEAINIREDIKDEIEFISDDEETVDTEPVKKPDLKVTDDESVLVEDDTEDEIEIEEEFELIEKTEDEKQSEPEKKDVETADKKTEEIVTEDIKKEEPKEEVNKEEPKEVVKPKVQRELTEKEIKAKAADDVFARIAAYKKKKQVNETDKDEKPEDNLIDKFVTEVPSIKRPDKDAENNEVIVEEPNEQKPVVTELMASIYINQGKYDQAIEIYEQLILKNPEKKDYFAAKIEETQNLK